jgi:glutathione S-transferase
MQLITIPFSHFCEKGRWTLDRTGAAYRELQFAPVLHRFASLPFGSATVPVLVDAPAVVRGSNEIIEYCDQRLPEAQRLLPAHAAERSEVEALVKRFDEVVAPQIRLWVYSWANEHPQRLFDYCVGGLPSAQRPLMKALLPGISKLLTMHFKLGAETHRRSADLVSEEFAFVSDLVADGRQYLVGDRFSAADLAFAAFVGSAVSAPEYGGNKYTPPHRPDDLAQQADEWATSAAGEWVREIYARHRSAGDRGALAVSM